MTHPFRTAATLALALAVSSSPRRPAGVERGDALWAQELASTGFRSLARYGNEDDAVAAGRAKRLGAATLEGPAEVEVDTYASWTLRFTVGRAGLKPGGGIRL